MGYELKESLLPRIFLTLGIILLTRIGAFLPVPGVDLIDLYCYLQRNPVAKNLLSTFSGDDTFVIGLFTLNIFPYINATILVQLLVSISPELAKLQKEGDLEGRRYITRLTRIITLIIAFIQSTGIALYLRPVLFNWNTYLGTEIAFSLTTGVMIVLWLSDIITDYGFGNGTSLLIYINIVSNVPNFFKKLLVENGNTSALLSFTSIVGLLIISIISFYGIVFLQNGQLDIPLISAKQLNQSSFENRNRKISYLPLRFNQAGVMPIILTTSFLVVPTYLLNLGIFEGLNNVLKFFTTIPMVGFVLYWFGYSFLIISFSSFYSSIVLNPKDLSDQLQKMAVKILGVRPGIETIFYLKRELQRISFIGAILLAIITIVPNFMESTLHLTSFNGLSTTSLLILAGVILDLKREFDNVYFSTIYSNIYR
jgi:preprotein translocase subunit SecY